MIGPYHRGMYVFSLVGLWGSCVVALRFGLVFQTKYTTYASFFCIIQSNSLQNWSHGGTWRLCGTFLGPRGNHGWSLGAFLGVRIVRWHGFWVSFGVPWGLLGYPWDSQEDSLKGLACNFLVKASTVFKAFFHTPFQEGPKCQNHCFS